MEAAERTRDVFEQIAAYPKPPLIPLPDLTDINLIARDMGFKSGLISKFLVNAIISAIGFKNYLKKFPSRLEEVLRSSDARGGALFAPVINATLAFEDDVRQPGPIKRAATLLFAARSLHADIMSGALPPDEINGQVLEMGQYPNFFATTQIIENNRARIFKSTRTDQITVLVAGRFFTFNFAAEATMDQVQETLQTIVNLVQENKQSPAVSPGVLTCANNQAQIRAFQILQKDETNRRALEIMRHSFLILCLDLESQPSSSAESAKIAHSENYANRWFHHSLQIVVFGNGKAGAVCNFSTHLDGNIMMRGAAELQRRAAAFPLDSAVAAKPDSLPPPSEIRWNVQPQLLTLAQRDVQLIHDDQQATFEISGIGRKFFEERQLEAVPAFIAALQMTVKKLTGEMACITQFLTLSKYRCMDLVTPMVSTPELTRFAGYMGSGNIQNQQARTLLKEACASQNQIYRKARQILPVHNIFTFYMNSLQGFKRTAASWSMSFLFITMRFIGLFKPQRREVLISYPEMYAEIPVIGRPGVRLPYVKYFGLHYQIFDEKITVTMMPGTTWKTSNAEVIAVLTESLQRLRHIVENS